MASNVAQSETSPHIPFDGYLCNLSVIQKILNDVAQIYADRTGEMGNGGRRTNSNEAVMVDFQYFPLARFEFSLPVFFHSACLRRNDHTHAHHDEIEAKAPKRKIFLS